MPRSAYAAPLPFGAEISTVLDASLGKPAAGVEVSLSSLGDTVEKAQSASATVLATG
jgi:5-hydroxyisourate hydrolase-like protein (transthyretin family)